MALQLRIAFSGASGTGKTTTAKLLSIDSAFSAIPVINPDARGILASFGFASVQDVVGRDYVRFQQTYIERLLSAEGQHGSFLTERSSMDCLAFWNVRCVSSCSSSETADFASLCIENARSYTHVFYFPWGVVPFEYDGWRGEDLGFFAEVDRETRRLYAECGVEYREIASTDRQARCVEIKEALEH